MRQVRDNDQVLHPASERGFADHGWLQARHSFSFAGYYNPERMGFGKLRVINDDSIAAGKGFAVHPHKNMEIITVPISGSLQHKDSEGNTGTISFGEIQVMSAGRGIQHSEYNASATDSLNLLQIWVLPRSDNTPPRYDQMKFGWNKPGLTTLIAPDADSRSGSLAINQDAWFSMLNLAKDGSVAYKKHLPTNGVYAFVIEGRGEVAGTALAARDAVGLGRSFSEVSVKAETDLKLLIIEVPV